MLVHEEGYMLPYWHRVLAQENHPRARRGANRGGDGERLVRSRLTILSIFENTVSPARALFFAMAERSAL
jgi:hypothetical protein